MSGNTIGNLYKVTTFGESHGKAIGCVIDGCPSGIEISKSKIQKFLNLRSPGINKFVTQRKEKDKIHILSGIFNKKTTGTPIGVIVFNKEFKSNDYKNIKNIFRPGHADFSYFKKYKIRDFKGGGRSSARTTISIVIAGFIAKKILKDFFNINLYAYIYSVGKIKIKFKNKKFINSKNFFIPNKNTKKIQIFLNNIKKKGNSIGATICLDIYNIFPGIGEPIFNKLDSKIFESIIGINAIKGIEIGNGSYCSLATGKQFNDEIYNKGYIKNNSGGIIGGISNGDNIKIKIHIKPTSSIAIKQNTINKKIINKKIKVLGRHDPCVGLRAVPILISIISIILIDLIFIFKSKTFL
ncbi:chorismate synthase [Candidatus Vidania fulgoroideorum]